MKANGDTNRTMPRLDPGNEASASCPASDTPGTFIVIYTMDLDGTVAVILLAAGDNP